MYIPHFLDDHEVPLDEAGGMLPQTHPTINVRKAPPNPTPPPTKLMYNRGHFATDNSQTDNLKLLDVAQDTESINKRRGR